MRLLVCFHMPCEPGICLFERLYLVVGFSRKSAIQNGSTYMHDQRSARPDLTGFAATTAVGMQNDSGDLSALEPHFSVQVLAEMWRLDESTIRRIFEDAPGVLRLGNER